MSHIMLDILVLIFGCALSMAIIIVALTYRELKVKKSTVKQDNKGWPIMNAYRDSMKAKREQEPDRLLGVMRDAFVEIQKQELKNHDNTG